LDECINNSQGRATSAIPQSLINDLFLDERQFDTNNDGYDYLISAPLENRNWVNRKTEFWSPKVELANLPTF
jgi:hypothetical protein